MPNRSELLRRGPFPNHIDPWAEQARYFHQLHGHMIGYILDQITEPLMERSYRIGREASLQIAENSIPDIQIQSSEAKPQKYWDYSQALVASALEAGVALSDESDSPLDALAVREPKTGKLVTVLEIVSPSNKADFEMIQLYQARRKRLKQQGVNIVEIDFTRSLKRLVDDRIVTEFPYHVVIHPYDQIARFLGMKLTDSPIRFGLPLRADLIPVELNPVYREAYEKLAIAWQLEDEGRYADDELPFPSLISQSQRKELLSALSQWRSALKAAKL